jgi:hypothetical protein
MLRKITMPSGTYLRASDLEDFMNDPRHAVNHLTPEEVADLFADVGEQLRSDFLTEDDFRSAVFQDAIDDSGLDLPLEEADELLEGLSEILDLCDIVEAVEKGHIIYG